MKWFEGKKVSNELKSSGFKTDVNQNELLFSDKDQQLKSILLKDIERKGYGMKEDGTMDELGKKPHILSYEEFFHQFETHKKKIKELQLFKET